MRLEVAKSNRTQTLQTARTRRIKRIALIAGITLAILILVTVAIYLGAFVILSPMMG
jgi:hypothetical protein